MKDNMIFQFLCFVWRSLIRLKNIILRAFRGFKKYYKRSRRYKKILIIICTAFVALLLYLLMVDFNFLWLFGKSPTLSDVSRPQQNIASELYSADGKLIGKYYRENRTPVDFHQISPCLVDALIATEDARFYKHFGIDIQGLLGAMADAARGEARGGSTITQQLAKNMFKVRSQYSTGILGKIPGIKIIIMKSKEWILALKLEAKYSKEEILTMYFNTVDFGSNTFGIKTAAQKYFATTPADIKTEQAATLVGLLKATSTYNPFLNPERSLERRNTVLGNMFKQNNISRQQLDSLRVLPIELAGENEQTTSDFAPYFRQAVARELEQWCTRNSIDLYGDGLKIYTTLDTRMQHYAEEAANKQMQIIQNNFNAHWGNKNPWRDERGVEMNGFIEDIAKRTARYKQLKRKFPNNPDSISFYLNKKNKVKLFDYKNLQITDSLSVLDSIRYMVRFMHLGFVAMEPENGFVKAWVGDVNFNSWKYDKALSKRQPGSTFKLFVYAAAIEDGASPCDYRTDTYINWESVGQDGEIDVWAPRNAGGIYSGANMSLKAAFARSVNTIAVKLAKEVGISEVIETAHKMGIQSPLARMPSTALGASDVSLLELVNAYCTAINEGRMHAPVLVVRITDNDGNEIYRYNPAQRQAINYQTAFLLTEMLQGGMREPGGTSAALWGYKIHNYGTQFGGKTGTSSNHSDAWFVGVSPHLVGGAWVGGEYRCIHFRTGALGQGSRTALPVFGYFMEKVLADNSLKKYRGKFPEPKQKITKQYQCVSAYYELNDSIDTDTLDFNSASGDNVLQETDSN
ncbi:MAG: penicillin-binding protein [Prevotellaceae bacterium]|jgi:penicillin-binding protein 1A|nr:penicillin-binding protein [Prevotellaceae bacterium]